MKKKVLAGILAFSLVFGSISLSANVFGGEKNGSVISASAAVYGDFKYSVLDDGTIEITKYSGSDTSVNIPSEIDGKSVTRIGEWAFFYCSSLTEINIPDSVKSIEACAFNGCKSLTKINIPSSVTSIDNYAFGYMYSEENDTEEKVPNFTIKCYKDTAGYQYAIDNGFDYVLLDDNSSSPDVDSSSNNDNSGNSSAVNNSSNAAGTTTNNTNGTTAANGTASKTNSASSSNPATGAAAAGVGIGTIALAGAVIAMKKGRKK